MGNLSEQYQSNNSNSRSSILFSNPIQRGRLDIIMIRENDGIRLGIDSSITIIAPSHLIYCSSSLSLPRIVPANTAGAIDSLDSTIRYQNRQRGTS